MDPEMEEGRKIGRHSWAFGRSLGTAGFLSNVGKSKHSLARRQARGQRGTASAARVQWVLSAAERKIAGFPGCPGPTGTPEPQDPVHVGRSLGSRLHTP